jgi:hypothetical protein
MTSRRTDCVSAAAEGAPHRKALKYQRSCAPKAVGCIRVLAGDSLVAVDASRRFTTTAAHHIRADQSTPDSSPAVSDTCHISHWNVVLCVPRIRDA